MLKKFATSMLIAVSSTVWAQSEPLRFLLPYAPGGSIDKIARAIEKPLEKELGRPVVVDYKAGAGGLVGAQWLKNHQSKTPTIMLMPAPSLAFTDEVDAVADFPPVYYVGYIPEMLVARPEFKYNTLSQLMNDKNRGKLNLATVAKGDPTSTLHARLNDSNAVLVPYKGSSQSIVDVMAGHVDLAGTSTTAVLEMIAAGKLKGLGVGGPRRSSALPNIPTFDEQGIGWKATLRYFIFVNRSADADEVKTIVSALNRAVRSPEFVQSKKQMDLHDEPYQGTVAQFFSLALEQTRQNRP